MPSASSLAQCPHSLPRAAAAAAGASTRGRKPALCELQIVCSRASALPFGRAFGRDATARPRDRPALRGRATAARARAVCLPRTRLLEACARASAGVGGGAAGGPIAHSAHRDTGCPLAQAAADSRVARAQAQLPACLPCLGGPAWTHSPSPSPCSFRVSLLPLPRAPAPSPASSPD